ncbi:Uncharacterised protein [Mycobacteroides abscessus subsp. abscessus]|nr:Uncharacterised protein [Mycobacteroides abscessus subsp. abscessus]
MRAGSQRLVAFEHDHGDAVGVGLLEQPPHVLHRLHGGRVGGAQRDGVFLAHLFELGSRQGEDDDKCYPADDDGDRQAADPFGHEGGLSVCVRPAHADFTKQ